jgi:hypothetical protein
MDERQTKIIEGAGLEDSRVNQEFIDLLKKWYQPVMVLVLILAGAYAGVNYLKTWRVQKLDAAFASFNEASSDARPEAMLEVAQRHEGRGTVAALSRITAADLYLSAAQLGVRPGTEGTLEEDRLDDSQAAEMLARAGELYAEVYNDTRSADGQELLALGARWGMVAVALSNREFDEASAGLNEIIAIADEQGFDTLARDARELLEQLPELRSLPQPVEDAPPAPEENAPEAAPGEGAPAPESDEPDDSDG